MSDAPRAAGTLFVVATPIGNLEDITLRAIRVLKEVAAVAAEDTRRTVNLLRHYGITTPLVSLHQHNERHRAEQLVARLGRGDSIALVSDAGTPGISDPGADFVRAARAAGVRVDPVPGPSAVTAALSASGVTFERYAFAGFPPTRGNARNAWFNWVDALADVPVVGFEAPHRIVRTLQECREKLVDRPIIVARELTKLHEDWVIWSNDQKPAPETIRDQGEFVFILGPKQAADAAHRLPGPTDREIADNFGQLTGVEVHGSRREAIRAVAARLGLPSKAVYDALERVKKASQT